MRRLEWTLCFDEHQWVFVFAAFAECEAPEGDSEVGVVERVDEGVDGAVGPPEPGEERHQVLVGRLGRQERLQQVVDEERQPARNEAADDHAERLRRLRLPLHRRNADRHPLAVVVDPIFAARRARVRYRGLAAAEVHRLCGQPNVLDAEAVAVLARYRRAAERWRGLRQLDQLVQRVVRIVAIEWFLRNRSPPALCSVTLRRFLVRTVAALVVRRHVVAVDIICIRLLRNLQKKSKSKSSRISKRFVVSISFRHFIGSSHLGSSHDVVSGRQHAADARVNVEHHRHWNEKRAHRRENNVSLVLVVAAHVRERLLVVPAGRRGKWCRVSNEKHFLRH